MPSLRKREQEDATNEEKECKLWLVPVSQQQESQMAFILAY